MKELEQELRKNIFRSCYLFYGVENYLKKRYEVLVTESVLSNGLKSMNLDVFSDKNQQLSKIIDASETLPFMSDKRLVIIRNSELFKTGKKDDTDIMSSYINKIPSTSCLVFIEDMVDKRNKLFKAVSKHGFAAEFKSPTENDLINWVKISLKKLGNNIDTKTALYLIRSVGNDMLVLDEEVNKLADFKGSGNTIFIADIDLITTKSLQSKIFDLVSAIGNKKPETALMIYNNLLKLKESPFMILTMIVRQFRMMILSVSLSKEGFDLSGISKRIGQPSFVVREALKEARNFDINILKGAMRDCLSTDINIKTGRMNEKLAVEMLIVKHSVNHRIGAEEVHA